MQIVVNGRQQAIAEGTSLAELLKTLDLNAKQVAVEVNLQLVPRTEHAQHCLADGDKLEVVTIVGGG
jgi:thiamine biosynthesis protein ThiS